MMMSRSTTSVHLSPTKSSARAIGQLDRRDGNIFVMTRE
jgi:hypothetical protein